MGLKSDSIATKENGNHCVGLSVLGLGKRGCSCGV